MGANEAAALSLNPCFNGRYSLRNESVINGAKRECLNPCFNGRYSLRWFSDDLQLPLGS